MTDSVDSSQRGAEWHRWDLHVHTPESVEQYYGDKCQLQTWDRYVGALEGLPPEIQAVGINDYFTIAGYRRLRQAKDAGRLANLGLLLPVIELRLTSMAGHSELRKLNLHVIFSDELSPDDIQQFFLNRLAVEICLEGDTTWRGCVGTARGLEELGKAIRDVTPIAKQTDDSPLRVGFGSAAVDLTLVRSVLKESLFEGKYLTALGLGEWSEMRWDGGAAQKRDPIEGADFVLTCSPSVEKYRQQREKLVAANVNARLFHASDAHYFAESDQPNRLGRSLSWLKADLSFRGLQRAVMRFEDRVFVGDLPPKVDRVRRNKTKYIRRLEIRRRADATLEEAWFDTSLELNPGLVAVIGNQGTGKSALTDILALCGDSAVRDFTFLTPEKFCEPKQKKASQFVATLRWEDGTAVERPLDAHCSEGAMERVRYVPQGFFDVVTNETAVSETGKFYGEVKRAIFSHVSRDDRLDCGSFDELLAKRTKAATASLSEFRKQLSDLNREIITLEEAAAPSELARFVALVAQKEVEIAALRASPPLAPADVAETEGDAETQQLRSQETALRIEVASVEAERARLKKKRSAIDNAAEAVRSEERHFQSAVARVARELQGAGVELDVRGCFELMLNMKPFESALTTVDAAIAIANERLDPAGEVASVSAVSARLAAAVTRREERERELESAARAHEAFRTRRQEWQEQLARMEGVGTPAPDSLVGLREQVEDLRVTKPAALRVLEDRRRQLCREIHSVLATLAAVFRDIARPVQQHIADEALIRDRYKLNFDVVISERSLADRMFAYVGQSTGTFVGKEPGRARLRTLIAAADFETADSVVAFADHLLDQLKRNHKNDPPTAFDLSSALKQGASLLQVYDLLFGLDYLGPTFHLALNGKPLRQLSPGERGILLLVFYLMVDRSDDPLIIDQPEGNLNNQSIVSHLVPVFAAAKERRQVIMVTHNPNLAVVCDAEQVVHCTMDIEAGYRLQYEAGALENPKFAKLSLDLLEGTARAFKARRTTYEAYDRET